MPARPTRRAVLGAAVAAGAAGCTSSGGQPRIPDPDRALLAQARAEEAALAEAYDALLPSAPPALRPTLNRLREAHAAHVVALGGSAPPAPSASPEGAPGDASVGRAVAAEGRALQSHRARAEHATSGTAAGLLACVAAAAGSYATTLRAMAT